MYCRVPAYVTPAERTFRAAASSLLLIYCHPPSALSAQPLPPSSSSIVTSPGAGSRSHRGCAIGCHWNVTLMDHPPLRYLGGRKGEPQSLPASPNTSLVILF
ncbi:hypothetical protein M422DRAFT_273400 [Sphaerobolus stellatus SS14]|uniref:Uncharacterized protein n=1 Tax=Sphaerobolus stellatus (strain SS14) TaxID=990650 RepID=A0A0C9UK45_SPHS4|nr:hypothetical protein M422DRAFT_273400 [Sphaerobolus stellatus SS14]